MPDVTNDASGDRVSDQWVGQVQDGLNALGIKALYVTTVGGTTDASGFLTVTHGAPFTPNGGWFSTVNPASSGAQEWGIDTYTATTCRLRVANANGTGALASTAVSLLLFLVKF